MSSKVQILNCGECQAVVATDDNFCQDCGAAQKNKTKWVTIQMNAAQKLNDVQKENEEVSAGDFLSRQAEQLQAAPSPNSQVPVALDLAKSDLPQVDASKYDNGQDAIENVPVTNDVSNVDQSRGGIAYRSSSLRSPLLQALEEREDYPVEYSQNFRIAAVAIIVVLFLAASGLWVLTNFKSINSALSNPNQPANQQKTEKPLARLSSGSDQASVPSAQEKSEEELSQADAPVMSKTESAKAPDMQTQPQVELKQTGKAISEAPVTLPTKKVIQTAAVKTPSPSNADKPVVAAKKSVERKEKFASSPLMTSETPPHLVSTTDGVSHQAAAKSDFNDKDKEVANYNKMLANFFSNPDNLASKEPPTFADWVKSGKQEF
jgi:hypothetical protein